jgi:hypothetical protein
MHKGMGNLVLIRLIAADDLFVVVIQNQKSFITLMQVSAVWQTHIYKASNYLHYSEKDE